MFGSHAPHRQSQWRLIPLDVYVGKGTILAILIVVTRGMNSFQFRVGIRLFTVQTRFLSVAAYFPQTKRAFIWHKLFQNVYDYYKIPITKQIYLTTYSNFRLVLIELNIYICYLRHTINKTELHSIKYFHWENMVKI